MSALSSKDCPNSCVFAFADGRRCTMPAADGSDYGLCYFHHQQYIDRLRKQHASEQMCLGLASNISTACDLSAAFTRLFRATTLGYIKPKTAHTLTYLGNLMLKTHLLAKQEYESAFQDKPWPDVVAGSLCFREDQPPDTFPGKSLYPPDPGSESSNSTEMDDTYDPAETLDEQPATVSPRLQPCPSSSKENPRQTQCSADTLDPSTQHNTPRKPAVRSAVLLSLKENIIKMRQILDDTPPKPIPEESPEVVPESAATPQDEPENMHSHPFPSHLPGRRRLLARRPTATPSPPPLFRQKQTRPHLTHAESALPKTGGTPRANHLRAFLPQLPNL
jgi:hypothetical protein